MYKQLLAITFSAFILTACGGSDDDDGGSATSSTGGQSTTDSSGTGSDTDSDGTGGVVGNDATDNDAGSATGSDATNDDGTTVETASGPVRSGVSGSFGDAGSQDNAVPGVYTLCPANTESFSTFAELGGNNFCVPGCPAVVENDDGDDFGSIVAENGDRFTCLITPNAPGSDVEVFFSAPINGCPAPDGCPEGSFPPIFITADAGENLAGTYNCADWSFNQRTQDWGSALATPAPFSLTLNADLTANIDGTDTTWSFANGVLSLEGNRTFNNVAVGNGSFTEYFSNTYVTRCAP